MADLIAIKSDELRRLSGELAKLSQDLSSLDSQIRSLENELRDDVSAIGKYSGSTLLTGSIGNQRAFAYQASQLQTLSGTAQRAAEMTDQVSSSVHKGIDGLPVMTVQSLIGGAGGLAAGRLAAGAGGMVLGQTASFGFIDWLRNQSEKILEILRRLFGNHGGTDQPNGNQTNGNQPNGDQTNGNNGGLKEPKPSIDHDVPLISAWSGDRNSNEWPDGYKGGKGCAVASTASALTGLLGQRVLPKDIMAVNAKYEPNNAEKMYWSQVGEKYGVTAKHNYGLDFKKYPDKAADPAEQKKAVSALDEALIRYQTDPKKYAAPIIGVQTVHNGASISHKVVVTGKNADGTYNIVDSSGNNAGLYTFKGVAEKSCWQLKSKKKGGFVGQISLIYQYQK